MKHISSGLLMTAMAIVVFPTLGACLGTKSMKAMTNKELLVELQVADEARSREAANEFFGRGASAIPTLASLRGNKMPFAAASWLGKPTTGQLISSSGIPGNPGSDVPVEVASLYLITAIYKRDLHFAQSPYLTDLNLPADERSARNSDDLVKRAWVSTSGWIKTLESTEIQTLREEGVGPLDASGVAFW